MLRPSLWMAVNHSLQQPGNPGVVAKIEVRHTASPFHRWIDHALKVRHTVCTERFEDSQCASGEVLAPIFHPGHDDQSIRQLTSKALHEFHIGLLVVCRKLAGIL